MIRFANFYLLYLLILIPIFLVLFWLYIRWKKKSLNTFGEYNIITTLFLDVSKTRQTLKLIIFNLAFFLLIIGLANPQIGSKLEKVQRKGVDLMIALDISNSMLAEDIKPNRLEKSKFAIQNLVEKLENDRIGIIVFAGKAFTQLPITSDHAAAKMFASTINTDLISTQGTAIGAAIESGVSSFNEDNKKNKAIIIISDGENHEDDAVEAAKEAIKKGIHIYTIGIGSPEGAPIPVAKFNSQFKRDTDGNTVVTKLNEVMLQQIAATGNGIYVRASNSETGLNTIYKEINKLEKNEYDSKVFSDYEDRFQIFIGAAFILFLLELIIVNRKNKFLSKFNPFDNNFVLSQFNLKK